MSLAFRRCVHLFFGALLFWGLSGCRDQNVKEGEDTAVLSGYTCCNFRYNKDWINDVNYAQFPMIPAGTPVKVLSKSGWRAYVEMNGTPYRMGLDYGRTAETLDQWLAKLIVAEDPNKRLASYPAHVQKAIKAGQVMLGMTKEQVIMSLGYPLTNENPNLNAPIWRFWWSAFGEYQVVWDMNGRVSKVTGHNETLAFVLAPGSAGAGKVVPPKGTKTPPKKGSKPSPKN